MSKSPNFIALFGVALLAATVIANASTKQYGIGEPASPALQAAWNDDVRGIDGKGLPPGHGSVQNGQNVYEQKCAACHGDFGEGNARYPELAGGRGTLTSERPLKTVGSYWPYAPTVFDYIRRAMPFNAPGSLTNNEVYAVTAFVLNLNDIVPKTAVLDARSLAAIKMPNRHGFINEHLKPDVHAVACMHDCKTSVKITSNLARTLGITPDETGDTPSQTIATTGGDDSSMTPGASSATPVPAAQTAAPVAKSTTAVVTFAQIAPIVATRCAVCHATHPTEPGYIEAPAGVRLDTPARIRAQARQIKQQAVDTRSMPLGNVTHMTPAERALLGKWINAGAQL